jgi:hypothetical protein
MGQPVLTDAPNEAGKFHFAPSPKLQLVALDNEPGKHQPSVIRSVHVCEGG